MIDIALLQAFTEVAKIGNMTSAALNLNITQPALSSRIRMLEAKIERRLFYRKKKGMELNDLGRAFLEVCKGLGREMEHVDRWMKDQRGYIGGKISISAISGVVNYVIPDFLKLFVEKYPKTKFIVEENMSAMTEDLVLGGSFDMGIVANKPQKKSLKAKLIFENHDVIMVCSPEFAERKKDKFTANNIQRDEMLWYINPRSRSTRIIAKHIGIPNLDSIGSIKLPDMETCKIYALRGLGAAFVGRMLVGDELRDGRLVEIPGFSMKLPIYFISRNEEYHTPLTQKFKEGFFAYCSEMDSKWKGGKRG